MERNVLIFKRGVKAPIFIMSEFKQFSDKIKSRFSDLQKYKLFKSSVCGDTLWDAYITGFKKEDDPIFRDPNSSTHTCNNDKNFIRKYGNVVALNEKEEILTMWDGIEEGIYKNSANKMSALLSSSPIQDVFIETYDELNKCNYEKNNKKQFSFKLGIETSFKQYTQEEVNKYGRVEYGKTYQFNHFNAILDKQFVDMSGNSQASILSNYRANKEVLKRGLDEISLDALYLVRDLISQKSLLDGTAHLTKLNSFIDIKLKYDKAKHKDNFCWNNYQFQYSRFNNELIGTLCNDISKGVDLEKACQDWNKRVDPANYMKAVAPITKKQIEEAKKFVQEQGYEESFNRRFATIDDINVDEILHTNSTTSTKTNSVFDSITATKKVSSNISFGKEMTIEEFMQNLHNYSSVELMLENRMQSNLVALTTANEESKNPFKWDNKFSWTYNGNLAGVSQLAQMVQSKGGRVDGVFRFTHSWNRLEPNQSLMDLHVFLPTHNGHVGGISDNYGNSERVGWNKREHHKTKGVQDVDYTYEAPKGYIPVENITFPDISVMPEGTYICKIHNWSYRKSGGKGEAEIAFNGNVYQYVYPATKHKEWVTIAEVTLKNGQFSIKHILPLASETQKEIWNLKTNELHKVNLICYSPNHWGDNNVGNKHVFFMLEDCKSDEALRSFHVENLNSELLQHRKVMEVLGNSTKLEPAEKQLCGVGFNTTVTDEVIVRVNKKQTIKIKF